MSDFLRPQGLQQARLLCPQLSPRVCSNSCLLSWWCYLSLLLLLLLHLASIFPSIRVFSNVSLFTSGGQSIGASASASVLPLKYSELISFRIDWLTSLLSKGLTRVFSSTTVWKHLFFGAQPSFFMVQLSHLYVTNIRMWLLEKPLLWRYRPLLAKWCLWFLIHCLS